MSRILPIQPLTQAAFAPFGQVIEADPGRLTEVAGIGPWRAEKIVAGWAEQKAVREIMIFLHAHGVGTARAVRIFRTYGHEAIRVMTTLNRAAGAVFAELPAHALTDVTGFGLLGHLRNMTAASRVTAEVWADRVPVLAAARTYVADGIAPGFHEDFRHAEFRRIVQHAGAGGRMVLQPEMRGGLGHR